MMINAIQPIGPMQSNQQTPDTSGLVQASLVPRDPNAPVGPRPTFEVTPMERLREVRPPDTSTAPRLDATRGLRDPDAAPAAQDDTAAAVSAEPAGPTKRTGIDIRA